MPFGSDEDQHACRAVKRPVLAGVALAERECSLPTNRDDWPRQHVMGHRAPMRSRAHDGAQATRRPRAAGVSSAAHVFGQHDHVGGDEGLFLVAHLRGVSSLCGACAWHRPYGHILPPFNVTSLTGFRLRVEPRSPSVVLNCTSPDVLPLQGGWEPLPDMARNLPQGGDAATAARMPALPSGISLLARW